MTGEARAGTSRRWRWSSAWAIIVLALAACIVLRDLLFAPAAHILATADIEQYFLWIHRYVRAQVWAGRVPLWNPYIYAGTPLAANPQATLFYPPAWVLLIAPVAAGQRWLIVFHVALSASFLFLLLRRWGMRQSVAVIASLPWALGSYALANAAVGHLTTLFAAAWLPLVIYCCERAGGGGARWLLAAGAALGVQVLAGEPQSSFYTSLAVAIYVFARTVDRSFARAAAAMGRIALIALTAAGIAAVQLLPTAELARHSDREANSFEYATAMSLEPRSLIGLIVPASPEVRAIGVMTDAPRPVEINTNWEFACYIGLLPLLLAGVGLWTSRGREARALKLLLLVAIMLALGRSTPVYAFLLKIVPGLSWFRIPARALVLVVFALCALGALGLQWLLEESHWRRIRWRVVAAISTGAVVVFLIVLGRLELLHLVADRSGEMQWARPPTAWLAVPIAICAGVMILLVAMRWMSSAAVVASIAALVTIDLLLATPRFEVKAFDVERDGQAAMFREAAKTVEGPLVRVDFPPAINANAAMEAGAVNINGYWPLSIARFYRYAHAMRKHAPPGGDRHELAEELYHDAEPFPLRELGVNVAGTMTARGIEIHRNAQAPPRAWIARRVLILEADQMLARMRKRRDHFLETVLLEQPLAPPLPDATPARVSDVRLVSATAHSRQYLANSDRDAVLVLSEVFYPGWRVSIDGNEVRPLRANYSN